MRLSSEILTDSLLVESFHCTISRNEHSLTVVMTVNGIKLNENYEKFGLLKILDQYIGICFNIFYQ